MMRNGSTNQSGEILAGSSDFVPTALTSTALENSLTEVDWQSAMKRAIRSAAELRKILGLPAVKECRGERSFATFVPWEFLSRMQPGDPDDPLLRQVLPIADEDLDQDGFTADPVGDLDSLAAAGLIHKYDSRALLVATGACGIHCRYCFRREFPYVTAGSRAENWQPALEYLRQHSEIEEVILSGGDPLTATDEKLSELLTAIEEIPHVRRLRIHSRMPIVIPQRITPDLVQRLQSSRLAVWMVVHANHPQELSNHVLTRLSALINAGIPVLNQAVLLRRVNDDAATLILLCQTLINHRVQPYYLHQLDRVRGAAHFEVPVTRGLQLIQELRQTLPGYAVPQYVMEERGAQSKTPISQSLISHSPISEPPIDGNAHVRI